MLKLGKIFAPNMFHCRNLTLLRTWGHFHPRSNYLQYRPHVHYRRHLTHLNTPECRCTTIPVILPWSLCHRTTCKHVANSVSMVGGILFAPIRYHCIGLLCCRTLEGQCSLRTQNDQPLPPKPLIILWSISLTQSNCAFFPSWLMRSSFVYNSEWYIFLRREHDTWQIFTHTAFSAFCRQLSVLHGRYYGVHLTPSGNKHK